MNQKGYFFISYVHENRDIAKKLSEFLMDMGVEVWWDTNIQAGTQWSDELESKILETSGLIVLLTEELKAREKSTVFREIEFAKEAGRRLLPIKLCKDLGERLKSLIGDIHYIDLTGEQSSDGLFDMKKEELLHFCNRWESDDQLMAFDSWLSDERKREIVVAMKRNRRRLEGHRREHVERLETSCQDSFSVPAWWRLSSTHSEEGNRAIIGFKHKQCSYRSNEDNLGLGCFNCGYYAGAALKSNRGASLLQLKQQLLNGLREVFENSSGVKFDVIEFLSDGSFLDANEYEVTAQREVMDELSDLPWLRRVLIESRPEFVEHQRITDLMDCLNQGDSSSNKELEIGIGLETADDFIRNLCINKGFSLKRFEEALDEVVKVRESGHNCSVVCYLIIKPAFLSEEEAIEDTIITLRYLRKAAEERGHPDLIRPKLEPAAVSRGTMLSLLYNDGEYQPLNYWSVLEILTRAVTDENLDVSSSLLRIGAREDMDDVAKVPAIYIEREGRARFDQVDFAVYTAIQDFNRHGYTSPSAVVNDLDTGASSDERLALRNLLSVYTQIRSALQKKDSAGFAHSSRENWRRLVFSDGSRATAIEQFYREHQDGIASSEGSDFLQEIYQTLDILEAFDARRSEEFARAAAGLLRSDDKEELANLIERSFTSNMVGVRVVDIDEESDFIDGSMCERSDFYRVFLEVQDFVTRRIYPIWTQIDVADYSDLDVTDTPDLQGLTF